MKKLNNNEIKDKLNDINDWYLDNDAIRRDWEFADFVSALKFISQVGDVAEKHDHHPEIFNVYNKVSLRFNTHFVNGITQKDFDIARDIDNV